jgi:cytochrome oxidase Cu insertion factor (SCO1/SenC/PrrC family)
MTRAAPRLALRAAILALGASLLACSRTGEGASGAVEASGGAGSSTVLAQPAESPISFGEVAPFAFAECRGGTVKREDLLGEPWVACSIFTRCIGPCPAVTSTMKKLQARLAGSRAKLVTFSVDPEYDTPPVLKKYADDAGADPKRWLFLTGKTEEIDKFIRASFLSPVERDVRAPVGERVSHSTRLVVVDKLGRVRGFYSGESDADVGAIVARVEFLEKESASTSKATPADSSATRR